MFTQFKRNMDRYGKNALMGMMRGVLARKGKGKRGDGGINKLCFEN